MKYQLLSFIMVLLLVASSLVAVDLTVDERSNIARINEPVTCGVPLLQGFATSVDELVLSLDGVPVNTEFRDAVRWPDNSLRWVHMDFPLSVPASGSVVLSLDKGSQPQFDSGLVVEEESGKVTVTTSKIKAEVIGPGFNILNRVWLAGEDGSYSSQIVASHSRGLVLWVDGTEYLSSNCPCATIEVESSGSQRVVLKTEGDLRSAASGSVNFKFICRIYFYNDSPVIRLAYTFENRGNFSEGVEDKVVVEALHAEMPLDITAESYIYGKIHNNDSGSLSAGSEAYVAAYNTSEFMLSVNGTESSFGTPKQGKPDRPGWIAVGSDKGVAGVGLRYFWQMRPSTVEARVDDGMLTVGMVPRRYGESIDIYSAVARTHYMRFVFLEPGTEEDIEAVGSYLAACQKPLLAVPTPEYYCRTSKVFGNLLERNDALYPPENIEEVKRVELELDKGLTDQLTKVDNRSKNGVAVESYGLLNWGDGMHYAWESGVNTPRNIAWNHHYYDLPYMTCLEFARTGDYKWYDYFISRSYHLMDVHVTHLEPGHRLDGANRYCPPTDHVRVDPTSNAYSSARVYISPYTNHHKTQGLWSAWYLTGDERTLDIAYKASDFANAFGGYSDWKQPRGAAFQVLTLIEAYKATGDEDYLETARNTFELHWNYFNSNSSLFFQGYFMVGFMLEAFIDYYEVEEDDRVIDWMQMAVDFMYTQKSSEKYSNMALGMGWLASVVEDEEYRDMMKIYLAKWKGNWSNAFKDYGLHGRSVARALYYLSYEGMGLETPEPEVIKGDVNEDGELNITDVIALILLGIAEPANPVADFNADGKYNIQDAISLVLYLREQAANGVMLASSVEKRDQQLLLTNYQREQVLAALNQLGLTEIELEQVYQLLETSGLPRAFSLSQNRPNPFNPSTSIDYEVPAANNIKVLLKVYDIRGRAIKTLVDETSGPGHYTVAWDGRNEDGEALASGIYFYRLEAGEFSKLRKMVLLK